MRSLDHALRRALTTMRPQPQGPVHLSLTPMADRGDVCGLRHDLVLLASAAAQWGVKGLVEIVVLSGFYQMFAAINQGFDIRPPA